MSIRNEFNWYVNNTKVYLKKINNAVDIILSNSQNPNNCFIDNYDFDEIVRNIFNSLQRVVNSVDSYPCITDEDIVNRNNEITSVMNKISNDIIEEFGKRNYQIKGFEGAGLYCGGLNFKKKR